MLSKTSYSYYNCDIPILDDANMSLIGIGQTLPKKRTGSLLLLQPMELPSGSNMRALKTNNNKVSILNFQRLELNSMLCMLQYSFDLLSSHFWPFQNKFLDIIFFSKICCFLDFLKIKQKWGILAYFICIRSKHKLFIDNIRREDSCVLKGTSVSHFS